MTCYARFFRTICVELHHVFSRIARPCKFSAYSRVLVGSTLVAGNCVAQAIPEQGFRIMNSGNLGNCIACHALPGQTGILSTFGPSLEKVATRYGFDELRQWVTDARKVKPDTLMPPFGTTQGTNAPLRAQSILSDEQILHVVAALQTLK